MSKKTRLKYEKPVSIDMGRVAPILGDTCSTGSGADECPAGFNESSQPYCNPSGLNATGNCNYGTGATDLCNTGSGAGLACNSGSGFDVVNNVNKFFGRRR
ncbi:MAG: hypothetical protein JW832_01200 [Deltaproteobacteria bacterium]|nr:hypothetical protein [Deltaproteobacteria bacterium]